MTTSFVYFILAVISILLCVVRHGIAAAAAERLAQKAPEPVLEEAPEQVSGTDELRARLVEIGRKHASTRAYHDRHGKNVEDFRERTMAELFPGSTRNVASVAIVISCLFAVGCGGLRPANNPSFGIQNEYNCKLEGEQIWLGTATPAETAKDSRVADSRSQEAKRIAKQQAEWIAKQNRKCNPEVVVFKVDEISCLGLLCVVSKKRKGGN